MTSPPFITNFTLSSSVMSARGSPETAMMSANLPFSSDPIRSCHPSISAATVGCGLNRLRRRHPVLDHVRELERLRAVGKGSNPRAERDFHTACDRNPGALLAHRRQAVLAAGRFEVLLEIIGRVVVVGREFE